VNIIPETRRAQ